MKKNLIIKLVLLALANQHIQALDHGDTVILKRQNAEKYLAVSITSPGGTGAIASSVLINQLDEEPTPKANCRWTVRKVGAGKPNFVSKISQGDKILLENTATGFYIQPGNSLLAYRNETGTIGSIAPNWEDPANIITWNSSSETEIKPFTQDITYKMIGKIPSVAGLSYDQVSDNITFLNQALNCTVLFQGIKSLVRQTVKDSTGKIQQLMFGIAPNGSLYRLDSGQPVCVQNRHPLYSLKQQFFNIVSVPKIDSVDIDKNGYIVVGDSQCMPTTTIPVKLFAPLWQKVSDLLYTIGVPTKVYPDSDNEIIRDQESKKPWFFMQSLNPVKYCKNEPTAQVGMFIAYLHDGTKTSGWPGGDIPGDTTYKKDLVEGPKGIFKPRYCKIGNSRILARQAFPSNKNVPLLVIDNVETSKEIVTFPALDSSGNAMVVVDYDVDDRGLLWVLNDAGEIWRYPDATGKNGVKVFGAINLFENATNDLFDKPAKISVSSSPDGDPDIVCVALISSAGQAAFGVGDYSKLDFRKLSYTDETLSRIITGITSASVSTDGKNTFYNFCMEIKSEKGSDYLNWSGLLNSPSLTTGLFSITPDVIKKTIQVQNQAAKTAMVQQSTDKSFIPAAPPEQPSNATLTKLGWEAANKRGFAAMRTVGWHVDKDYPEWSLGGNIAVRCWNLAAGYNPTTKLNYVIGTDGWAQLRFFSPYTAWIDDYWAPGDERAVVFYGGWNIMEAIPPGWGTYAPYKANYCSTGVDGTICSMACWYRGQGVHMSSQNFPGVTPGGWAGQRIGWEKGNPEQVSVGVQEHVWATSGGKVYKFKYTPNIPLNIQAFDPYWLEVPGINYIPGQGTIAAATDGGLWFVDKNNDIQYRDPDGNIKKIVPEDPSVKFIRIAAAGNDKDFRLVALSKNRELFSADQSRPLSSENLFAIRTMSVAINGYVTISFDPDPAVGWQCFGGGRSYGGYMKGNNPNTGKPYEPDSWCWKGANIKGTILPPQTTTDPSEIFFNPLPGSDLTPAYAQATGKGFSKLQVLYQNVKSPMLSRRLSMISGPTGLFIATNGNYYTKQLAIYFLDAQDKTLFNLKQERYVHKDYVLSTENNLIAINSNNLVYPESGWPAALPNSAFPTNITTAFDGQSLFYPWITDGTFNVYKHIKATNSWELVSNIKSSCIASLKDGGLVFVDQTLGEKGSIKLRKPDGTVVDVPGSRNAIFVRVNAQGTSTNFKMVAIDQDGNLYSGDQTNGLASENISKVRYAAVAPDGKCAIVFPVNKDVPDEVKADCGPVYLGNIQWI